MSGALGPVRAQVEIPEGSSSSRGKLEVLRVGSIGEKLTPSSLDELTVDMQVLRDQLEQMLPEANNILGGVVDQLPGTEASEQAQDLRSGLLQLDKRLADMLSGLAREPLLEMEGLTASQQLTRTDSGLRAHAEAKLGSLSLLAGLLQIEGFRNSATAFAGGEPGTATASAKPEAVDLEIAGVLEASYGPEGLRLPGFDQLPEQAQRQLSKPLTAMLEQAMDALAQGGLDVGLAQERTEAAKDGTSAIAESGGLLVSFAPPGSGAAAFELGIGQVVASVAAKRVDPHKAGCGQASPPPEHGKNEPPTLAYTGPRIPHSGLLGFGLLGAAGATGALLFLLVLRRRRASGGTGSV